MVVGLLSHGRVRPGLVDLVALPEMSGHSRDFGEADAVVT